jgi:hypothetical protein
MRRIIPGLLGCIISIPTAGCSETVPDCGPEQCLTVDEFKERVDRDLTMRLDGAEVHVNYYSLVLDTETGWNPFVLMDFKETTCPEDGKGFFGLMELKNISWIPFGEPMDVNDPATPILVGRVGFFTGPGCFYTGHVSGTVTFDSLMISAVNGAGWVRGSFDLRVEDAVFDDTIAEHAGVECADMSMTVEMRWTNFLTTQVDFCDQEE